MSDSEEEEEIIVFADFKNQLIDSQFADGKAAVKIIGLDGHNPVAEISGSVFQGSYDFAMGTCVLFEKDVDAPPTDPLFEEPCKQKYKYFGKTNKVISFDRIFIEPTRADSDDLDAITNDTVANSAAGNELKLDITYEEAIKKFPLKK